MPTVVVNKVQAWRAMPVNQKRRVRQAVSARRTIASMAMEGEPVSSAWKTKHQRVA